MQKDRQATLFRISHASFSVTSVQLSKPRNRLVFSLCPLRDIHGRLVVYPTFQEALKPDIHPTLIAAYASCYRHMAWTDS